MKTKKRYFLYTIMAVKANLIHTEMKVRECTSFPHQNDLINDINESGEYLGASISIISISEIKKEDYKNLI